MSVDQARQFLVEKLQAVADGDRSALRDVYERTSAKLFGVCLRILSDREEAEDVLQEVYLTVWNKADRFDAARASPITWLATIARRAAAKSGSIEWSVMSNPVAWVCWRCNTLRRCLSLSGAGDIAKRMCARW